MDKLSQNQIVLIVVIAIALWMWYSREGMAGTPPIISIERRRKDGSVASWAPGQYMRKGVRPWW